MGVVWSVRALALVFSHIALFPAISYAWIKHLYPETALLIGVLIASLAFHICQVGWFCFGLDPHALQLADHFMVYTALMWFSLYFAGTVERARTSITLAAMSITLPVLATFIGSWVSGAIVIAITLVLTALMFTFVFVVHGGPRVSWPSLFIALILLGVGVVLHVVGGDYGPDNWVYPAAHTVWHIMAMLSLFYIIDLPYKDAGLPHSFWFWGSIDANLQAQQRLGGTRRARPARKSRGVSAAVAQPPRPLKNTTVYGSKRIELPLQFRVSDDYATQL